jgi:hypothetical protein
MLSTPPLSPREYGLQVAVPEEFNLAADDAASEFEVHGIAELSEKAVVAKEWRHAIVGVAETWVHVKGLQTQAKVVAQRDAEEQETERCRISEEARTKQMELLAEAYQTHLVEEHRTKREKEALRAQALRDAIQVRGKVQVEQLRSQSTMLTLFQWMTASLVGAVGATATTISGDGRRRRGHSKIGFSKYVSGLILITFVRHLRFNSSARSLLVWSGRLGPCLRGLLSQMLQATLKTILQTQDADARRFSPLAFVESQERSDPPCGAAERVEDALMRLATGRPLLGPDVAPECWERHVGPHGRTFWHNRALGPAPWSAMEEATSSPFDASIGGDVRGQEDIAIAMPPESRFERPLPATVPRLMQVPIPPGGWIQAAERAPLSSTPSSPIDVW